MGDTYVTFHGWVGNEVTHRDVNGVTVANLRVASTPRIKRKGQWMDGDTTWYSVSAWRALADNIRDSVKKGDALSVTIGRDGVVSVWCGSLDGVPWVARDEHAAQAAGCEIDS